MEPKLPGFSILSATTRKGFFFVDRISCSFSIPCRMIAPAQEDHRDDRDRRAFQMLSDYNSRALPPALL